MEVNDQGGHNYPFTSFNGFVAALKKHFLLHESDKMAQDALDKLVQGSKSCEEYTTIFIGYAEAAKYRDEEYLLRKYKA